MKEQIIKIIKQDLEFEYDYSFLDDDIANVADKIIASMESGESKECVLFTDGICVKNCCNARADKARLTGQNFLTPEEAKELIFCFIHESRNRYGKVNKESPLYLKLRGIASPILLKVELV